MDTPKPVRFELVGGHQALDFVNTVGGLRPARTNEKLNSFGSLVTWALQAEVLGPEEAKQLLRAAARDPEAAQRALERARAHRELIYRVFLSVAEGRPASPEDLRSLEAEAHAAWTDRHLLRTEAGYGWAPSQSLGLDVVVARLSLAATELLTGPLVAKVRVCEALRAEECGWLFLDQTRNHSRRWCEMGSCGNRHKARRHYARVRVRA